MKSSHHTVGRHGFIVLHKVYTMPKYGRYFLVKFSLREALKEVASLVFKNAWLNDEHTVNFCPDYFRKTNAFLVHTTQQTSSILLAKRFGV